jgi:hypothetical protein
VKKRTARTVYTRHDPGTSSSAQERFVHVREVHDQVLCLTSDRSATRRDYVTVIEVEGVNYGLKGPEEQSAIIAKFRALLNGLSFPLQILVRISPLNLAPYVAHLNEAVASGQEGIWADLARSHQQLLEQLAHERILLERHFYIVVPATLADETPATSGQLLRQALFPWGSTHNRHGKPDETLEQVSMLLSTRTRELLRQLAKIGLHAHRLSQEELITLYASCLWSQRSVHAPLPHSVLAGIGRPLQAQGTAQPMRTLASVALVDQGAGEAADGQQRRGTNRSGAPTQGLAPFSQLADRLAPASVTLSESMLCLGHSQPEFVSTIIIDSLPRELPYGWLKPLVELSEPLELSIHLRPLSRESMIRKLRWARTGQDASRKYAQRKGQLPDPTLEVSEEDTVLLMRKLVSGEESMLDCSLYVLVRAESRRALSERMERILAVLRSMQVVPRPALLLQDDAFTCCLPEARNPLSIWGNSIQFDGSCGSTCFPFMSNALFMPSGILEGITQAGEPVVLDRWDRSLPNPHKIVVAPTGYGKSYATKAYLLRLTLRNRTTPRQIIIVDPEREYQRIAEALGGQWIRLSAGSGHRINPFDLYGTHAHLDSPHVYPGDGEEREDRLALKIQALRELLQIMLANRGPEGIMALSQQEMGLLDHALYETYRRAGITSKSTSQNRQPPHLRDLYDVLEQGVCGPDTTGLLPRLYPYVYGSHRALFDGPTNVRLDNDLVVFDTRDLDSELAPVMLSVISEYVWTVAFASGISREFVIDEAGVLSEYEAWARFMAELTSRARKHGLAVTLHMQNIDLLTNRRARAILANCAIKVLMGPPSPGLGETFGLSENEEDEMSTFGVGDALMITPGKRILLHYQASDLEHRLATTHHQEVAQLREQQQVLLSAEKVEQPSPNGSSSTTPNKERRRRTRTSKVIQLDDRQTDKQTIFQLVQEREGQEHP